MSVRNSRCATLAVIVGTCALSTGCAGSQGREFRGPALSPAERAVLEGVPVVALVSSLTEPTSATGIAESSFGNAVVLPDGDLLLSAHQVSDGPGKMLFDGREVFKYEVRTRVTPCGPVAESGYAVVHPYWRVYAGGDIDPFAEPSWPERAATTVDFDTPVPLGEIVYIVTNEQQVRSGAPATVSVFNAGDWLEITRKIIAGTVTDGGRWKDDPEIHQLVAPDAVLVFTNDPIKQGTSGSPVYWWPDREAPPRLIGIVDLGGTYKDFWGHLRFAMTVVRRPRGL